MLGVGFFVAWLGYAIMFYGLDQLQGGNNGFLDLVKPGAYKAAAKDTPGSFATAANAQGGTNPGTPAQQQAAAAASASSPTFPTFANPTGNALQQAVGGGITGSVPGVPIFGPPNPNAT